ncbi:MAG: aldo/keto reductase [Chloroflexi bacterium]|nr:MAG: aldo/keto reductase [Chloroflexota bacterium]
MTRSRRPDDASGSSGLGIRIPSARSVAANAKTPSLNASTRPTSRCRSSATSACAVRLATPEGYLLRRRRGATDFRARSPRFAPQALAANAAVVELLKRVADRKNATPAQIALAWLLARKPWIVPIPGTTKLHRLEENIGAASLQLTQEDMREIDDAASKIDVSGERLPEDALGLTNR